MLLSVLSWLFGGLLLLAVIVVAGLVLATWWIAAKAERLVPANGKFIEIDGNRIHYVETGEGRPIVFLHGLGAQLHHFRHTLFDRFGPGYRLIALDRPGSGYSLRASGATGRLPEQAQMVRRFIEALGLERPLVVGHSLGGAIVLTLAVEHPETISGIALLAPLTHLETRRAPKIRPALCSFTPVALDHGLYGGDTVKLEIRGADDEIHLRAAASCRRLHDRRWWLARTAARPLSMRLRPMSWR